MEFSTFINSEFAIYCKWCSVRKFSKQHHAYFQTVTSLPCLMLIKIFLLYHSDLTISLLYIIEDAHILLEEMFKIPPVP